jgi:Spy/CpxP family protein refolding chaperone
MKMKRSLFGWMTAGLLATGVAFAAGGERCPMMSDDAAAQDCPMHDRPMHERGGKHRGSMDRGGPGMMHGPGMLLGRLGDELALSAEQRTKIKALMDEARPEMERLREEMRSTSRELAQLSPDDKAYDGSVATASRRMGELTTRMIQQRSALRARTHAVLTAEQKTQMAEIRKKMMERMQERRERREHRHEGMQQGPQTKPEPGST